MHYDVFFLLCTVKCKTIIKNLFKEDVASNDIILADDKIKMLPEPDPASQLLLQNINNETKPWYMVGGQVINEYGFSFNEAPEYIVIFCQNFLKPPMYTNK